MTISLARQVARIQLQLLGEQARLDVVRAKRLWPPEDIEVKRIAIAELEATLRTLRWLHDNEDRIKARIEE